MPPDPERFARHGPLRVSPDQTHLVHNDGTPFFYLADTAWNGPLLSTDADWQTYLDDRANKGFTAIQFVTHAPWTAALTDREGQTAFNRSSLNDSFFTRLERKIQAINDHGLLAAPVLAWAANFGKSRHLNPGHTHTAKQLIPLIQAQLDRLKKFHTLLILAGDGYYHLWRARKWKTIARAVFSTHPHPVVTLHPAGLSWPYHHFKNEPWLTIHGYQSSHSEHPTTLTWLQSGPATRSSKPTINLEPCYEGIAPNGKPLDHHAVRRALYWSLLNAPTAGVAYGAHGLWSWNESLEEPLNHPGTGIAQPWHTALNFPGSQQVAHLAALFTSINWWTLRPDPILIQSPNPTGPAHIAASRSASSDLALIYLPKAQPFILNESRLHPHLKRSWFNPRTGTHHAATSNTPPDQHDWLLVLK